MSMIDTREPDRMAAESAAAVRTHYQSKETAVIIPFWQALVTGLLAAIVTAFVSGLIAWQAGSGWGALLWGLGVFFIAWPSVTLVVWLNLQRAWRDLIWTLEGATGIDLSGDGAIGNPDPVRVQLLSADGRQSQFADLPGDRAAVLELARNVVNFGLPFSERQRGSLSQTEFRQLRDLFVSRGWAVWNDSKFPKQGVALGEAGIAVLRGLVEQPDRGSNGSLPHPTRAERLRSYALSTQHAARTRR